MVISNVYNKAQISVRDRLSLCNHINGFYFSQTKFFLKASIITIVMAFSVTKTNCNCQKCSKL